MSNTHLERIEPTWAHATRVVELTRQELHVARVPELLIDEYANADNDKHVHRQLHRLTQHPDRYIGAFNNDELLGFVKHNVWSAGDQLAFSRSSLESLALSCLVRAGNRLPSRPEGIHALAADSGDSEAATVTLLHDMVAETIRLSGGRQVRVAEAVGTTSLAHTVLLENGFESTGLFGQPIEYIEHELYARQP